MSYSKFITKRAIFSASRKNKKVSHILLFIVSCIFTTVYLVWRTFFTIPLDYGMVAMVFGVLLLIAEIMAAIEAIIQYRQINKRMIPELPEIPVNWYPDVDIFIATHNEAPELLYKTLNACKYLRYPDKNKVHIYLCDDTNRHEMAELAIKLNVGYFGLSDNREAKAGNLNNALKKTNSPLVVTLDSDMIPTSDFLIKTVPYFFLPFVKKLKSHSWVPREKSEIDPNFRIGFIQAPQSFYNPDLFQFNLFSETRIPNEQDYFFVEVNVGRNADNGVIYAGSNTVLSRKSLEDIGYIATSSITEDFLTGLRMQKRGYTTYAIPDELAHGLAPNSITSLLKQRERWGRGCIQSLKQEHLLKSTELSIWTKLSYIATWSYWWAFTRRLVYIISPIVTILFNLPVMDVLAWQVIVFWLPHYLFGNKALKSFSSGVRNRHWSNVYDTILFPYLIVPIILETIGVKKRKFIVTNKSRSNKKQKDLSILLLLPHAELFLTSLLALIICIQQSIKTNSFYNPVIFFWLIMNTKNIVFAIFFMYGRENFRMADRYYIEEPVTIKYKTKEYQAKTKDISETGMAILFTKPVYLPPDTAMTLNITYKDYSANMQIKVLHAAQIEENWKYGIQILGMDDKNKSQYMQIVYDRSHTMPRNLDTTLSIFDDFNINFTKRSRTNKKAQQTKYTLKKISTPALPCLKVNIPITINSQNNKTNGTIEEFNYHYAIIKYSDTKANIKKNETLTLNIRPGTELHLEPKPIKIENNKKQLYRITNIEEFIALPHSDEIIDSWLNTTAEKSAVTGEIIVKKK